MLPVFRRHLSDRAGQTAGRFVPWRASVDRKPDEKTRASSDQTQSLEGNHERIHQDDDSHDGKECLLLALSDLGFPHRGSKIMEPLQRLLVIAEMSVPRPAHLVIRRQYYSRVQ